MKKKEVKNNKTSKQSDKSNPQRNKHSDFYKKNFKSLILIPIFLFLFSCFSILNTIGEDGTPIHRDISLKGGLSAIISINSEISIEEFQNSLTNKFQENSFTVSELFEKGQRIGFIVDTDLNEDKFKDFIQNYFKTTFEFGENYSSNFISPTLSNAFFKQAIFILIISFLLMSGVIFLYFKEFVPSGAVVLSALFDVIVTIGILDLFGFKISIAGIGALLMLIGYSIDTDVLLTNRLIKEFGHNYFEKTFEAFKTGSLMSFTTLMAGFAAIIISTSDIIQEIAIILVVGLLVDYVSTWVQNTGLLLWWLEKKEGKLE